MSPLVVIAGVAIIGWGVIIILTGLDVLHFEHGALATAGAVLVGLVKKAFDALKSKPKKVLAPVPKDNSGFSRLGVIVALVFVSSLFIGCVHTFQCKTGGMVKLVGNPDGSAYLVAPCDGDPEAVRIEWDKFTGLRVRGLTPPAPVRLPEGEVISNE